MRALINAGWTDEAFFILIMARWVYSAFDPEGAEVIFENWKTAIPEWYQKITMWLVASVIGIKKIGDFGPALLAGFKAAIKK